MIIETDNLVKSYGEIQAVRGLSFSVKEGELFSFLGVNGAGKSTTINILTTYLAKTSGRATIGGFDIDKQADAVRAVIGIVFQDGVLDDELTARENLETRAWLYGLRGGALKEAVNAVIAMTNITEFANRRYKQLSGGQRRRTDIARALINRPKLLFLDEPTTGLDPATRQDIWRLIRDLQESSGMTVFLTTHYMEEAAESDDIVIIEKGQILAQGTPTDLKIAHCKDKLKLTFKNGEFQEHKLENTLEALPIIARHEGELANVEIINGTLDDVFINLTNNHAQGGTHAN